MKEKSRAVFLGQGKRLPRRVSQGALVGFLVLDPFSISLAQICVTIGVLAAAADFILSRRESAKPSPQWPLWLPFSVFAVITVLSAFLSQDVVGSLTDSKQLLEILILYWALRAIPGFGRARLLVQLLILAAGVMVIVGLFQFALSEGRPLSRRPSGTLSIYQTFSGILVIVTLLSLSQALSRTASPRERWFAGGATLLLILGLLFSLTRGAWVGFGAGVILLLILQRRARWLWVLPVVIALLFLAGPRELRVRLQHTVLFNEEASGERVLMWKAGLQMAREFPVLGVGTDMVKPLYPDYRLPGAKRPTVGHLHNSPLQVTVERGTLGLAAWIWIWVSFFFLGTKTLKNLPQGPGYEMGAASLAAVAAFLTAGLFEYNFGDSEVVMLIYFVMALPFIAQRPTPARPGQGVSLS